MAALSGIIGSNNPVVNFTGQVTRAALDAVYRHSVILLSDISSILGITSGSGETYLPLIGFTYEHPSQMTLLRYEYSEYPYLDKTLLTNSYLKQNTELTIRSFRAITSENGMIANIALNEAIFAGIEFYCDRGGTFRIMTMWGTFGNYVLEELSIVPPDSNQAGGIGFEWKFKRIPFDTKNAQQIYSSSLSKLSGGLV